MSNKITALAKEIISIEMGAIESAMEKIDEKFNQAVELVLNTEGRVVVVGMGKSGLIGRKIAATLSSTGSPAFFVHPAEAFHGDLGMIRDNDTVLMISNSGETEELIRLLLTCPP